MASSMNFSEGISLTRKGKLFEFTNSRFLDRKSTRLNSSHLVISYAVFCLKKKKGHQRSDHRFLCRLQLQPLYQLGRPSKTVRAAERRPHETIHLPTEPYLQGRSHLDVRSS